MAKSKTAGKKNMTGAHRGSVKKYAYGGKVGDPQRIGRTEPVRGVMVKSGYAPFRGGATTVIGGRGVTAYKYQPSTKAPKPSPSYKEVVDRQSPSKPSRSSSPSAGKSSSRSSQTPAQRAQAARRAERSSP
jgi:hypothetical protein